MRVLKPKVHKLFRAQSGFCWLCGTPMQFRFRRNDPLSATRDHVIPEAQGGTWEEANIRLAHLDCNHRRAARAEIICLDPPKTRVREGRDLRRVPLTSAWLRAHGYMK